MLNTKILDCYLTITTTILYINDLKNSAYSTLLDVDIKKFLKKILNYSLVKLKFEILLCGEFGI